jgi:hypothetical protein
MPRPQAEPRTRTTLAVARDGAVERPGRDLRAGDRRERVDPGECVQDLVGGDDRVQAADQRRALDVAPQRGLAGEQQGGCAEHPDEGEAGRGAEHEPAGAVERPQRREAQPGAEQRTDHRADRFQHGRPDDRAGQPDERRVRRVRAARQDDLRQPRSDHGAGDDPGDREQAGDEPLAQPDQAGDGDDHEQDPVQPGHVSGLDDGPIDSSARPQ